MSPQLFWIPGPWKGKLAITSRPRGGDWLKDEVRGWGAEGIDIVVSLLEPHEVEDLGLLEEVALAKDCGIRVVVFPIQDRGTPTSLRDAQSLLRSLTSELDAGRNVAIHCRQSVGRSSLIAAGLLIVAGNDSEQALRAVATARRLPVPETAEQLSWIRDLTDLLAMR